MGSFLGLVTRRRKRSPRPTNRRSPISARIGSSWLEYWFSHTLLHSHNPLSSPVALPACRYLPYGSVAVLGSRLLHMGL